MASPAPHASDSDATHAASRDAGRARKIRSANAGSAERQRRRRTTRAARKLCLIGSSAMLDAVGEAGVHLLTAKVEIRFARVSHRPTADPVVEVEQARLVGDFRAGLCRHEAARRRRWDRGLLVARTLAKKTAGADRNDTRLVACRLGIVGGSGGRRRRKAGAGRRVPRRSGWPWPRLPTSWSASRSARPSSSFQFRFRAWEQFAESPRNSYHPLALQGCSR